MGAALAAGILARMSVGRAVAVDPYLVRPRAILPRGTAGPRFGGAGRFSGHDNLWNGIVGGRGRSAIGESGFFVPSCLGLGTGFSNFTWQTFAGIVYQNGWAGVSPGWRNMSHDQGGT